MSKEETKSIIAEVEKAKINCLTTAQKNIEDNNLFKAMDDLFAARLFIDSALKQTRALIEKQGS